MQPVEQILERDRTQAEFTLDLESYLKRRLTRDTIRTARRMHTQHRAVLAKVENEYGVPSRVLVSVWGLESNFGKFAGVRPTIPTLVTLAYDPRRGAMFRNELFSALEIVNRGDIELDRLKGSWAGALGQPQFMPSSYLKYAQDFDGDGRKDIWAFAGGRICVDRQLSEAARLADRRAVGARSSGAGGGRQDGRCSPAPRDRVSSGAVDDRTAAARLLAKDGPADDRRTVRFRTPLSMRRSSPPAGGPFFSTTTTTRSSATTARTLTR